MTHCSLLEFTDSAFAADVLNSDVPVLVDFWAPWCGPCRMLTPMVEELAREYADRIKVGKLNIDDNQATATEYAVTAIPTLALFKNGNVVARFVGVPSKAKLQAALNEHAAVTQEE